MAGTAPRIGLVILAAGGSRRMGTPKQLLEVQGTSLIERCVAAALASPVWPVVVVVGEQGAEIRKMLVRQPVLIVDHPGWAAGMASSLRVGMETLRLFSRDLDAAVIALCDQPRFSAASIQALLAAQAATGASTVAAQYAGRLGAPVLVMAKHFPTLQRLDGDEGARAIINADPAAVGVDLPELSIDLDTPADVSSYIRE